jgi:ketosteroid isomerase-like protein
VLLLLGLSLNLLTSFKLFIMKNIVSIGLFSGLLILASCKNKEQNIVETLDAKALMSQSSDSFIGLWNSGDAPALSGEFTNDAVRVISNSLGPIVGGEAIKNSFEKTFSDDSELKNSRISIVTLETRLVSDNILIGAGTFKISDANNVTLESGKWGNVYQYKDGKVKFLLESAHRDLQATDTLGNEGVLLDKSFVSKDLHFNKIQASIAGYIKSVNEKDANGLSMLFTENAIQNVSSNEGIVVGRDNIKASLDLADGMVLDANIIGYTYLGDSLSIAYGNWTSLDTTNNTMVRGQWGNVFEIQSETAYLVMESAGRLAK